MKTTKLHTFEEILTTGITVEGQDDPIKISCIYIPKIQRSYAQGRKAETDIRTDFLDDIFSVLTSSMDEILELNFLFGSKQSLINGTPDCFELLDGQQRTTTLFLLNWYFNVREATQMPNYLSQFTYETRDTSTNFLSKISNAKIDLSNTSPSDALRANKWFTDDFNCDPTICSMLNMLDEIHKRYNELGRTDLLDKLNRLQFYVLLLEKFDMNDELYIKMNSRGLSLTPFENFKASIVRYMKNNPQMYGGDRSDNGVLPYWLEFTTKIDTAWIDVFWQNPMSNTNSSITNEIVIDDKEIGNRYFRFFNRYFFTKAAVLKNLVGKNADPLQTFFYKDCEDPEFEKRFRGWNKYEELFGIIYNRQDGVNLPSAKRRVFSAIEKILDVFREHKDFIYNCIHSDPYGNTSDFDVLKSDKFTLSHRAIFAAVTEFIEALPTGVSFSDSNVKDNFKRMLRVAFNVIENTSMETEIPTISVIKVLSEINRYEGATNDNFYHSLAINKINSRNEQIQDEQEKAKEMFDTNGIFDASWENAFIMAEKHSFFKGSVCFFFSPKSGTSKDFEKRFDEVKNLFDGNGITQPYRDNGHILIRALLSCLNHWDKPGMQDLYFTENQEKENYLKSIVTGKSDVRKMFCTYFSGNNGSIDDYLKNVVKNASCRSNETNEYFKKLYYRLVLDESAAAIYDAVSAKEKTRGCFRIQNYQGTYCIRIPGKQYDQLVLHTERHEIVRDFVDNRGFQFEIDTQRDCVYGSLHDAWGWNISLVKHIPVNGSEYTLKLVFNDNLKVLFYVYGSNVSALEKCFDVTNNPMPDGVKVPKEVDYWLKNQIQPILDCVREIEESLQNIEYGEV